MSPIFFPSSAAFRDWLSENHKKETELLVGYYKINTGKPSMTWSESVDEALCFGWIDGVRRSVDIDSYCIRFTPRKPTSIWSAVNIKKMEELIANGKMQDAGLEAYAKRKEDKSKIYSYEKGRHYFPDNLEAIFKSNAPAWEFFNAQPEGYKKQMTFRVISAKQEATQLSRLEKLIGESEKGKRML